MMERLVRLKGQALEVLALSFCLIIREVCLSCGGDEPTTLIDYLGNVVGIAPLLSEYS